MNSNDLKAKLAAQKKWREPQPTRTAKPALRLPGMFIVMISVAVILIIGYAVNALESKETVAAIIPTAEVPRVTAYVPIQPSLSPTPSVMKVCVKNMHVRYTPNGSVRGYLKEGESVTLKLDQHGQPITQVQNRETWILASAPVEGWANEKYLCTK